MVAGVVDDQVGARPAGLARSIWEPMRASASSRAMPRRRDQPLQGQLGRGVDHDDRGQRQRLAVDALEERDVHDHDPSVPA